MAAFTRRPVLVALAAAGWAEQLEALTDGEVVATAMQALARMFPGAAPAWPRSYMLSRWGQDPWARGSLSFYDGGCAVAAGVGRLRLRPRCCVVLCKLLLRCRCSLLTARRCNPHLPACSGGLPL